jgi:hypothetical protein
MEVVMKIVHWKDIVEKNFGTVSEFEKITKSILFCERADMPVKTAFKDVPLDKQEAYDKTRWLMRNSGYEVKGKMIISHGWYSGYIEKDVLKFLCTAPQSREYITIPQYMDWKESQGVEDMVDEYYQTRDIIDNVSEGLSEPHSRKDIYDDEGEYIK